MLAAAMLSLALLTAAPAVDLSPQGLVALFDEAALPGTVALEAPPTITGDPALDARIRHIAVDRGYRLRPVAAGGLVGVDGHTLQPAAAAAWEEMQAAAALDGIPLVLTSGFRSVETQRGIFVSRLQQAGTSDAAIDGILRLVSIPGYSKHHTGYAVDLTQAGFSIGQFRSSAGFAWLSADNYANARRFGFVPSYPDGASRFGPDPEPWEYVFVPGLAPAAPIGSFESARLDGSDIRVTGWAADVNDDGPTSVHVYVNGRAVRAAPADRPRGDVARALPSIGGERGFDVTVDGAGNAHEVCVYAINDDAAGPHTLLGCKTVETDPFGAWDLVATSPGRIRVIGWAADPKTTASIATHVWVDGATVHGIAADEARPDVARAFPGAGPNHGFDASIRTSAGPHDVCTYAINASPGGANTLLGCRNVVVPSAAPFGALDTVSASTGQARITGWATDPESDDPLDVHIWVDGASLHVVIADRPRPDVASALPSAGPDRGFDTSIRLTPGLHDVCAYAIDVEPGQGNPLLGCRNVVVPSV